MVVNQKSDEVGPQVQKLAVKIFEEESGELDIKFDTTRKKIAIAQIARYIQDIGSEKVDNYVIKMIIKTVSGGLAEKFTNSGSEKPN